MKYNEIYGKCPKCGSDWDGGDIPKKIRQHYSEPYKWSRVIGFSVRRMTGDRVNCWKCPDCGEEWDRD
jgi:predicted Zn-ribbon and HTH transcriptional regulator